MTLTYTWAVTAVTSKTVTDLTDVIANVRWSYTGTDTTGTEGVFNGATPIETKNIDPTTFVPFDKLTEELVLSWVKPIVTGDAQYWKHINDAVDTQITAKAANVTHDAPLPWSPPTPSAPV